LDVPEQEYGETDRSCTLTGAQESTFIEWLENDERFTGKAEHILEAAYELKTGLLKNAEAGNISAIITFL
jgi:hypothetical protein